MSQYYFVGTLLPELTFESAPEISFAELEELFRDNFSKKDLKKIFYIRGFYDILNLRSFWNEEVLDPKGELSALELSESIEGRIGLPQYVYEFIDRYEKKEDRLHHFPFLLARFFKKAAFLKDRFLRNYFCFERELRLVLTAFRAKKLGRDLSEELQYENPEEDLIGQILAAQYAKTYEPPEKYEDLKVIFDKYESNPLASQKALDAYRFEFIEKLVDMSDAFSSDRMIAYFFQFLLIEKWFQLDSSEGINIITQVAKNESVG